MKTSFLILLLSLSFIQTNHAQFSLSLEGGTNMANIEFIGFDYVDRSMLTQYFIGVNPQVALNTKLSFESPISYSAKGYSFDETINIKFRNTYIDVSPALVFNTNKIELGVGAYVAFRISEASKYGDQKWITDKIDITKTPDYGLIGTAKIKWNRIYLKVGYQYGLRNISDTFFTDENGTPLVIEQYNRTIQIGIGYYLIPKTTTTKN